MVTVAVKVIVSPAAVTVVPGLTVMVATGATSAVTVIVIAVLIAVSGAAHAASLVSTQVITSPVVGV